MITPKFTNESEFYAYVQAANKELEELETKISIYYNHLGTFEESIRNSILNYQKYLFLTKIEEYVSGKKEGRRIDKAKDFKWLKKEVSKDDKKTIIGYSLKGESNDIGIRIVAGAVMSEERYVECLNYCYDIAMSKRKLVVLSIFDKRFSYTPKEDGTILQWRRESNYYFIEDRTYFSMTKMLILYSDIDYSIELRFGIEGKNYSKEIKDFTSITFPELERACIDFAKECMAKLNSQFQNFIKEPNEQ